MMKIQRVAGYFIFMLLTVGMIISCTGLNIPGAMNVQVCREGADRSSAPAVQAAGVTGRAPGDVLPRLSPDNAKIAFTRIWYPTKDTAAAILNDPANTTMSDFTDIADPEAVASGCVAVLDRDPDDPYVFDLDTGTPLVADVFPEADTVYPGVIIETLYYEFDINDFTIRWYTMGDGTYARKDVLIKTEASVTGGTGGDYKFAYVNNTTGKVEFFETHQSTAGYSSLVPDTSWNDWDSGGDSGLLPNGTHYVLHNDITTVNRFNSMFYMTGNAPEVIEYVILYNLSTEYGGVEYTTAVDADSDGTVEFSDLIDASGSREFVLTPITGAIEYSY